MSDPSHRSQAHHALGAAVNRAYQPQRPFLGPPSPLRLLRGPQGVASRIQVFDVEGVNYVAGAEGQGGLEFLGDLAHFGIHRRDGCQRDVMLDAVSGEELGVLWCGPETAIREIKRFALFGDISGAEAAPRLKTSGTG